MLAKDVMEMEAGAIVIVLAANPAPVVIRVGITEELCQTLFEALADRERIVDLDSPSN